MALTHWTLCVEVILGVTVSVAKKAEPITNTQLTREFGRVQKLCRVRDKSVLG